ncbi:MAG TPA: NADH-quinone oxidoreductase subunit NuoG [Solirubrobacteraceae bacterium]|nr:NADH-quinone oxidoreductase subunit NuoG [Solirubrobacteraceae bacterium]
MPRPERKTIQLTIDGREVQAIEGTMLVDAAKQGDVEIPYFCYEPKLGNPVGACRMCLVEIEGIPKLQTSCSTPVKDGMVVHTQTERVRHAQNAIVEFLLVNHPLDCPVCDKGGECPLQDITFGWGLGHSRVIEPKRHFVKPLALSPLIAIDRERCILCYRCVRFSQEISEDYQLIFAQRGADTFVATHDGHPYVAPFSGNIVELCPVGALTAQPYRFRARPWDIESGGGICTLCPAQCNVTFTVRDEKVMRVLARDNEDVDDGWLCDKGRFAYQAIHVDERITRPLVRDGGELRPVSWERALETAAGLARHRGRLGTLVGGRASNEEGLLLARLAREALASEDIDSRAPAAGGGEPISASSARALAAPALQACVADLEFAHTVLVLGCDPRDDAPILDLRIRKGVRRNGVALAIATARPTALEAGARLSVRCEAGGEARLAQALAAELRGGATQGPPAASSQGAASAGSNGPPADGVAALARLLREGGEEVVIVYGERIGEAGARALLEIADALGLAQRAGAGLLCLPAGANGRGLREAGAVPDAGPGYRPLSGPGGRDAAAIAAAAAAGEITALHLFEIDPLRDLPDRALWERALHSASLVVAHASVLTEGLAEHATVVFPAESHAEKEGTTVHPDGRLQRLRIAIAHPGEVRPGWAVLAELARRCGLDTGVEHAADAFAQLVDAVPFYAGLTLEEIGGRGVRWPARPQAAALGADEGRPSGVPSSTEDAGPPPSQAVGAGGSGELDLGPAAAAQGNGPAAAAQGNGSAGGALLLGSHRPLWASPECEISPSLKFLVPRQELELSPADARRLGIADGAQVTVERDGARVRATARLRTGVPDGSAFLAGGLAEDSANVLGGPDGRPAHVSPAADRAVRLGASAA